MKNLHSYLPSLLLAALLVNVAPASAQDTHAQNFATIGNWKLTQETQDGGTGHWCRAVGVYGDSEVTILLGNTLDAYKGGYMSVTMYDRKLPAGPEGTGSLTLNGNDAATGKISDVGNSVGGVRTVTYSRAEFTNIDGIKGALGNAGTLGVTAQQPGFKPVELKTADLKRVMPELDRCLR